MVAVSVAVRALCAEAGGQRMIGAAVGRALVMDQAASRDGMLKCPADLLRRWASRKRRQPGAYRRDVWKQRELKMGITKKDKSTDSGLSLLGGLGILAIIGIVAAIVLKSLL
ncbi:hypothetical protein AAV32_06530 [Kerstersia gyiorum]|uniref:Uncharacterized protein n=2 Tax=Kerstersia gyiorum TaxID=206506 RepID=A0A171KUT8_9BURK|nr:hypothetical protein AAV32_06530 [Kerstersia gyiorum]